MIYGENECAPQGTRIYCGEVTSRNKKYCTPIMVGFSGISDRLVIRSIPKYILEIRGRYTVTLTTNKGNLK
jgi:hypothetical protein